VQNSQSTRASAPSFSQMNEHEKAMVVHQSMNNSHSYSHELQAKKHREQAATQG
ncbi:copper-binding protein, partial [Citrobacter sp. TBCS-14]